MSTSSDSGSSHCSPRGRHYSSRSSNARTYQCQKCGNEFNSGQSLGGHMNVHRKDESRSFRNGHSSSRSPTATSGDYHASTSDSSSTYKGVRYRSEQNKWVAEIRPPKSSKTWWLGTYSTAVEAAYAYDVAITYFGSETSLNFDGHPLYDQIPRISLDLAKQDFAMQLRKVVKEYGKRAMQSHVDQVEEEEEESSSTSYHDHRYTDSSPTFEYPQPEEYVVADFEDTIDWDDTFSVPSQTDQSFGTNFDFDMPPVAYENYTGTYHPASDYEPDNGMYYNQMSPTVSDSEPSGYYNAYNQPQEQLWSPYCSY